MEQMLQQMIVQASWDLGDLSKVVGRRRMSDRQADAYAWVTNDDLYPLSFRDVCRLLDSDREMIRQKILAEAHAGGRRKPYTLRTKRRSA